MKNIKDKSYIIIFIISILILIGCKNKEFWNAQIAYEVTGTKTNVTIKYRKIPVDGNVKQELAIAIIDKLPFRIYMSGKIYADKSKKIQGDIWFLSASSKSEGNIILKIATDFIPYYVSGNENDLTNFTGTNYPKLANVIVSNETTENYAEVSVNTSFGSIRK